MLCRLQVKVGATPRPGEDHTTACTCLLKAPSEGSVSNILLICRSTTATGHKCSSHSNINPEAGTVQRSGNVVISDNQHVHSADQQVHMRHALNAVLNSYPLRTSSLFGPKSLPVRASYSVLTVSRGKARCSCLW